MSYTIEDYEIEQEVYVSIEDGDSERFHLGSFVTINIDDYDCEKIAARYIEEFCDGEWGLLGVNGELSTPPKPSFRDSFLELWLHDNFIPRSVVEREYLTLDDIENEYVKRSDIEKEYVRKPDPSKCEPFSEFTANEARAYLDTLTDHEYYDVFNSIMILIREMASIGEMYVHAEIGSASKNKHIVRRITEKLSELGYSTELFGSKITVRW